MAGSQKNEFMSAYLKIHRPTVFCANEAGIFFSGCRSSVSHLEFSVFSWGDEIPPLSFLLLWISLDFPEKTRWRRRGACKAPRTSSLN